MANHVTGDTYTDQTATNGLTYYYVITAVNSDGESSKSNEVKVRISAIKYLIIEVYDHYNGNESYINEIEVYDNEGRKINYTATEAFDSATNEVPVNWDHISNGKIKLYDGNYVSSPVQMNDTSTAGNGTWTRMVLDLQDNNGVSKVDVWTHNTGKPRKNKHL